MELFVFINKKKQRSVYLKYIPFKMYLKKVYKHQIRSKKRQNLQSGVRLVT